MANWIKESRVWKWWFITKIDYDKFIELRQRHIQANQRDLAGRLWSDLNY